MIVKIDKSFVKDVARIKDKRLRKRIADCIDVLRNSDSLTQTGSLKKILGESEYYRIRIGDFRL
jgi:mRNA interferase RelE/StbE